MNNEHGSHVIYIYIYRYQHYQKPMHTTLLCPIYAIAFRNHIVLKNMKSAQNLETPTIHHPDPNSMPILACHLIPNLLEVYASPTSPPTP